MKDNAPKGKSVCPKVSMRCARILYAFISGRELDADEERVLESFHVNLGKEIAWEEKYRAIKEKRKAERFRRSAGEFTQDQMEDL